MRKRIQLQILKMFFVFSGTMGLLAWQFGFVWSGVISNAYLNMTIIALFGFGIFLAFSSAFRIRNEELAFVALQEAYEDIKFHEERAKTAPFWRHYRCLEPGIVFAKPRLLSHVFDLTYEKMMRTREITISFGTMQSLVSEFKTKLIEDRAMLHYITGILVFLGLIGTFIGLMQMVGSVGNIIGSIATMDMTDTTAAFTKLIQDLRAPLTGMATGFSSSLFGLFGSLILGLLGRFLTEATGVLRGGLEAWLSGMADLDGDQDKGEEVHREVMVDLLEAQQEQLEALYAAVEQLSRISAQGVQAQRRGLELLQDIADQQAYSAGQSVAIREPMHDRGEPIDGKVLRDMNEGLEKALSSGLTEMSRAMETAFVGYAHLLSRSMALHQKAEAGQLVEAGPAQPVQREGASR
jgi:hypothetical protein